MPSRRSFAEIGRIVCINYGKDNGKIGVIVDMCDSMTCLIDGPSVERKLINFRRLAFTDIKLPIKKRLVSYAKQNALSIVATHQMLLSHIKR
mmetsp:Transcript_21887/g.30670  ORF Transcript_21887/g.30670 Transcript_21887/m.30670 type:complete len:92 (+) Transcript_21887:26-301(+)